MLPQKSHPSELLIGQRNCPKTGIVGSALRTNNHALTESDAEADSDSEIEKITSDSCTCVAQRPSYCGSSVRPTHDEIARRELTPS